MKEALRYVKNTKTGVVFPLTRVLEKMRKDLIPCSKYGVPLTLGNIDMPNLCNPYTGVIVPNNEENSRIMGLIPCRDAEHAEDIKASLMGMGGNAAEQTHGLQEPPVTIGGDVGIPDTQTPTGLPEDVSSQESSLTFEQGPGDEFITMLRAVDVEVMDKDACKIFAFEHFGEKLSKTNGVETLREKVQVMINSKLAEAA